MKENIIMKFLPSCYNEHLIKLTFDKSKNPEKTPFLNCNYTVSEFFLNLINYIVAYLMTL